MTINAIDFVREPRGGPKTGAGKAASSQNAVVHGLFAARDFILPGEEQEYAHNLKSLMSELSPEGFLEENFATEILGATWRLRRCRLVEWDLSCAFASDQIPPDPMVDEATSKQQKSVDRARAQSHNVLRRSISELSKLQTARTIRFALDGGTDLGLTNLKQVLSTMKMHDKEDAGKEGKEEGKKEEAKEQNAAGLQAMETLMALADQQLCRQLREDPDLSSFCKPAEPAPAAASSFCKPASNRPAVSTKVSRNSLCPCRSGKKIQALLWKSGQTGGKTAVSK